MQGIYGATKAAVISMTQTLAFELGGSGVRVNAIAPGLVETKFASAIVGNPMLRDHVVKRTPLARHGSPTRSPAPRCTCCRTRRRSPPARCWSPTAGSPA
jgi:NAD(P)-dependent dehydrogenase (short-subunit alcohol dehydrogenase family)